MSPSPPSRIPPLKRVLKGTMLWCARWLVGGDEFYAGRVKIEVTATDDGESVTVRSVRGLDGLAEPEPLNQPNVVVDESDDGEGPGRSIPIAELLAAMLSQDERNILAALCDHGPCKTPMLMEKLKIEKSKFWALWSNLQHRGLVRDAEDGEGDGGGFMVGMEWVRELVRGRAGKAA